MEERFETVQEVNVERFLQDLKAVVRDGQDLLKAGMSGVKAKALEGVRTTEQNVREHPRQSLGIVFGLGVLVGVLAVGILGGRDRDD